MKISELIKELEKTKSEHGDLPILLLGATSLRSFKDPSINCSDYNFTVASNVIWDSTEDLEIGDKFIWL